MKHSQNILNMPEKEPVSKILADLNPAQYQAVTYESGPLLIIAGAGTGKTTVIARRIAWLILTGRARPEEILAVTFTDKAAGEMEERVDKLLPYGYVDLWISTFHSFCQRVLEAYGTDIGLPLDFKVLDETQQSYLVRENFKKFKLDYYKPLGNPTKFIQALVKHFSRAKDELVSPGQYLEYAENLKADIDSTMSDELTSQETARIREVANAYHTYQQLLLEQGSLDFGDLINYTIKLFEIRPNILEKYRQQFKYILVDEFQDTNCAQYELLKMLASPKNNITAVADDKQAIYRWRGAAYNNVFQLKKDYPECKVISLVENYRSKQTILDLAYKFIQQNYTEDKVTETKFKDLLSKNLKATRGGNGEAFHIHTKTQEEEVGEVVKKISRLKEKNSEATWNDFAILVRANSQAEPFCQGLRWANIPYQFLAATGLFSKPIILDILNYLKLLDDYHESSAVYRILTSPIFAKKIKSEHISEHMCSTEHKKNFVLRNEDLVNLVHFAGRKNWSLYGAMKNARSIPGLSPASCEPLDKLLTWIEIHAQLAREAPVSRVIYAFLEDSGYLEILTKLSEKDGQGLENIFWLNQFFKKVENFERVNLDKTLPNFIRLLDVMLEVGDRGAIGEAPEAGPEAVKVLTIHGAKGLEFRWVFIVNLVDKRFPTIGRREPIELPGDLIKEIIPEGDVHLQEERRLFYVAMTRAKDGLYFSSAENYGGKTSKKLSRFLYEIGLVDKAILPERAPGTIHLPKSAAFTGKSREAGLSLPSKFSFTQLVAYETCPLGYKFAFILKIPRKGKYTFSFGRTMHNTLYRFLEVWRTETLSLQKSLFKSPVEPRVSQIPQRKLGLKDLLQIYEACWIDEWYEDRSHQEKYRELGKKILKAFYKDFEKAPPEIKYLEMPFNFKLGNFVVKGKVDRIDKAEDGLEIIDYKTGKSRDMLNRQDKEQLLIYQLAANELLKERISKLTYYYLEDGKRVSFLGEPEELREMKDKIKRTFEEIRESDFLPKPGKMCEWCDYASICEYRAV